MALGQHAHLSYGKLISYGSGLMLAKAILGTSICAVKKAHLFLLGCNDARKAFHELFAAVLLQGRQVPKQVRFDDGRHICLEGPQEQDHVKAWLPHAGLLQGLCHLSLCEHGVAHVLQAHDESSSQIVSHEARRMQASFKLVPFQPLRIWCSSCSACTGSVRLPDSHLQSKVQRGLLQSMGRLSLCEHGVAHVLLAHDESSSQIVSHEARRMQASFKARTISVSVTIESLMFCQHMMGQGDVTLKQSRFQVSMRIYRSMQFFVSCDPPLR